MKTRFLNKMAGLLAVLLLFSCTGKFEEYNTDNTGFTDEQKTYDYNTFGVWLKVVQMGIYFNYDWGSGKNWHFQTMQNLNADMFSGYMHDFKPFNAGLGNTVYNLQDGWNGTMWDNTYGYIMTEIKQTEDHSRDKYPAFYAIAKILKVEIMHRISDYYGPIVYTKFGESDAGVMPDSQKDAYYAFFQDLGEAIHLLSEYDGEETFSRFDMIMPENYRTFGEWMRFANSLRLRLAIRIAMADPDKARDEEASRETKLEKIITQKWIACYPEGCEAWAEQRRTGYPRLFPVLVNKSNGKIDTRTMIRRLNFPVSIISGNPAQYSALCEYLGGPDAGGTRLWWDTGVNFRD